ncbi:hypothetical protein I4U23_005937 [Adineta vaga]|nr:hypothetical protein I4U23_005937 [Adineta vaga]
MKINFKNLIKYLIYFQETYLNDSKEINISINEIKKEYQCINHRYKTRIISRIPLIIYIDKFLNSYELQHLIQLATPLFQQSTIYDENGKLIKNNTHRTSSTASIQRHETPIVQCIEERFVQFQGNIDIEQLEPLQVVKYTSDQEYKPHYDWFSHVDTIERSGQRITTFFTYLYSNCLQGETEFLNIRFDKSLHGKFCDILICDKNSSQFGLRFRPLPGNSIFWFNINEQGKGDPLTYHAENWS